MVLFRSFISSLVAPLTIFWMFLLSLERSYPPLTDLNSLSNDIDVHIMVLGSGHTSDPALPANNQLSHNALGRLAEGIRLHRLLPGSKLITSGW